MTKPMPRVGVGVIVLREGRVLLGRRRGPHGGGTWALPGGHLEFGESIEACAAREVLEETGLRLLAMRRGPYASDVFAGEERHYVTLFVLATAARGEAETREPEKCEGWSWHAWDSLPEPLFAPLATLRRSGYAPAALESAPAAGRIGGIEIRPDDLAGAEIRALLAEHLRHMQALSPPESVHALDIDGLRRADVTFWSAWDGPALLGCGALREIDPGHGEIKSMRTASAHLRRGTARAVLAHIVAEARRRGYSRLSLETGSMPAFAPARRLYEDFGFASCPPFADYVEDPYSVFMTLELR